MFTTQTIKETPNDIPGLYGFRIGGRIREDDLTAMADYVNGLFDDHDQIDMMLIFDGYEGSEAGAGLTWSNLKSRVRAVTNVRNYVVVGAPEGAEKMISFWDALIPVNAKTFETETDAMGFLRGQPPVTMLER